MTTSASGFVRTAFAAALGPAANPPAMIMRRRFIGSPASILPAEIERQRHTLKTEVFADLPLEEPAIAVADQFRFVREECKRGRIRFYLGDIVYPNLFSRCGRRGRQLNVFQENA